jgi:hypothetical protein
MNFFKREKDSGSAVKRAFTTQINDFLDQVNGPIRGILPRRGSSLDDLFAWGLKVLDEKRKLEQQLAQCTDQWQDGERKIHKLTKARDRAESQLQTTSLNLQTALADLNKERMDREREMVETKRNYESEMNRLAIGHSADMAKEVSRHDDDVRRLNRDIDKLVGQLLVNQNDSQAWPDDKLKVKFKELQRLVDLAVSPRHKEFQIPPNQQLGPDLDPANFLSRAGRGKSHYLLKSAIWNIFREQFFKTPFGFGAFGPGEAQGELMNIYFTWLKALDGSARTGGDPSRRDISGLLKYPLQLRATMRALLFFVKTDWPTDGDRRLFRVSLRHQIQRQWRCSASTTLIKR